jgi:hypothetical protein
VFPGPDGSDRGIITRLDRANQRRDTASSPASQTAISSVGRMLCSSLTGSMTTT